eukprot:1109633_1
MSTVDINERFANALAEITLPNTDLEADTPSRPLSVSLSVESHHVLKERDRQRQSDLRRLLDDLVDSSPETLTDDKHENTEMEWQRQSQEQKSRLYLQNLLDSS